MDLILQVPVNIRAVTVPDRDQELFSCLLFFQKQRLFITCVIRSDHKGIALEIVSLIFLCRKYLSPASRYTILPFINIHGTFHTKYNAGILPGILRQFFLLHPAPRHIHGHLIMISRCVF